MSTKVEVNAPSPATLAQAGVGWGVFWFVWGKYGFWWGVLYGIFWPVWCGYRLAEWLLK